jgi:hypothetical protein
MAEFLDVTAVEVVGDHRLRLTFPDGSVGEVDLSARQWRGIFEPLRDPAHFRQVAVDPELGTILWPSGADVSPETLYELGPP